MKKKSADVDPQAMIQALLETNARMQLTIDQLTASNQKFQETICQLTASNQKLQETVDSLNETVRELNEKLNKNSRNSSKWLPEMRQKMNCFYNGLMKRRRLKNGTSGITISTVLMGNLNACIMTL